jgi:hypothetical protein
MRRAKVRQNPSGQDLHGEGRVRKSALPLPRWIVDGSENLRLVVLVLQKRSAGAGVIIEI